MTNKKVLYFVIFVNIVFILSCSVENYSEYDSNGIIIHSNKRYKQIDLSKDIEVKSKIKLINNKIFNPIFFTIDDNGNIYIYDYLDNNISKYNDNFQFVKKFGRKGNGPGEFNFISSISNFNDTIFAYDQGADFVNKFSLEGEFIEKKAIKNEILSLKKSDNKALFLTYTGQQNKSNTIMKGVINFGNYAISKYNTIKTFRRNFSLNSSVNKDLYIPAFACSKNNIYIENISQEKYEILIYKKNGTLNGKITKNYRKTKMGEFKRRVLSLSYNTGNKKNINQVKDLYLTAIEAIWTDDQNRLFVLQSATDRKKSMIDIFEKNRYIGSIKFTKIYNYKKRSGRVIPIEQLIKFYGNYIYVLNIDKENPVLEIFKLNISEE